MDINVIGSGSKQNSTTACNWSGLV